MKLKEVKSLAQVAQLARERAGDREKHARPVFLGMDCLLPLFHLESCIYNLSLPPSRLGVPHWCTVIRRERGFTTSSNRD